MQKHYARLFADHVLMNGYNIDSSLAQCF